MSDTERSRVYIDFETYCDLDLKQVGLYKYVAHSSFQPWCLAYAFDDEDVKLWECSEPIPDHLHLTLHSKAKIYAHNAEFEWQVLKRIGYEIPLSQFVDTQALAATFGYPLSLDKFCKALGLLQSKNTSGTRLINKLCKLQKKTIKNPSGRWYPDTAPEDFQELYSYCRNDVEIMRRAVKQLPTEELSSLEHYVWGHTLMQNERGIPIDAQTITNIKLRLEEFKRKGENRLQIATGGSVATAKQVTKMRTFLEEQGLKLPNLTKETVETYLKKPIGEIPEVCRQVLSLRQQLAHSSTAKFNKMLSMLGEDNRIRGNLVYYGAHTGRMAGRGIQVHNLPRAKVDHPEEVIWHFNEIDYRDLVTIYPDLNATASALIRSMIRAEKGKNLIVADYSSIENIVLHWSAGDEKTVQDFRDGLDQYKVYSAARLGISYNEVTKEQRAQSKPDVLGLGFGGGVKALISVAAGYGVTLGVKEAQKRVYFYRKKYKKIPQFWRSVFDRIVRAVITKDPQVLITPNIKLEFRCAGGYLFILLPSGRRLAYPQVKHNAIWKIKVNGYEVPMSSDISYMGVRSGAWLRIGTHPGKIVENIIQAMARDILVYGMLCAEQAGYKILISVHDEAMAEGTDKTSDQFCEYLCITQDWAKTIPLKADGYVAKRYKKD